MALFRYMTKKSLVLAHMARSARQSVGSYPVLLNYSMTPSSRTMTQELTTLTQSPRFLQECQFLSTIKHPSIVQYLGTATDPQSRRPVLLMELSDGREFDQVPGTPAYMPPEALISPPHYSSKLDCFSHGVLALQIITRNSPNPGDASKYVDIQDPRFPSGRVLIQFLETERRKMDIDLIEPSHPLRPIALHCLKDRDTERPSADELCGRLASLKREPRYTHSVEQTRGHIQRLQEEIERKDVRLEENRVHIQRLQEEIESELERERAEHQRVQEECHIHVQEYQELVKHSKRKLKRLEMQQRSGEREKPADELVCIAGWSRSEIWPAM